MDRQFFNPPPISMSFDAFVPLPPPISVDFNNVAPPPPPPQPDPPASNSVPASKARGGVQSAPKGPNPITEATIKVIDQMSASVGGIVPLLIGGGVLLIILLR